MSLNLFHLNRIDLLLNFNFWFFFLKILITFNYFYDDFFFLNLDLFWFIRQFLNHLSFIWWAFFVTFQKYWNFFIMTRWHRTCETVFQIYFFYLGNAIFWWLRSTCRIVILFHKNWCRNRSRHTMGGANLFRVLNLLLIFFCFLLF